MPNNNLQFNRKHQIEFGLVVTETWTVRNEVKSFPADSVLTTQEMKIKQAKKREQIIRNSSGVPSSPQTKEFTLSQHAVEWADYYSSLRTLVEKRLSSRKNFRQLII